jgi:hypothetical protein
MCEPLKRTGNEAREQYDASDQAQAVREGANRLSRLKQSPVLVKLGLPPSLLGALGLHIATIGM